MNRKGIFLDDTNLVEIAPNVKPLTKDGLENTEVNRICRQQDQLIVEVMGRGMAWLDTVTQDSLLEVNQFVTTLVKHQGLKVACSEEIARRSDWLTDAQLKAHAHQHGKSGCGEYLKSLLADTAITQSKR